MSETINPIGQAKQAHVTLLNFLLLRCGSYNADSPWSKNPLFNFFKLPVGKDKDNLNIAFAEPKFLQEQGIDSAANQSFVMIIESDQVPKIMFNNRDLIVSHLDIAFGFRALDIRLIRSRDVLPTSTTEASIMYQPVYLNDECIRNVSASEMTMAYILKNRPYGFYAPDYTSFILATSVSGNKVVPLDVKLVDTSRCFVLQKDSISVKLTEFYK